MSKVIDFKFNSQEEFSDYYLKGDTTNRIVERLLTHDNIRELKRRLRKNNVNSSDAIINFFEKDLNNYVSKGNIGNNSVAISYASMLSIYKWFLGQLDINKDLFASKDKQDFLLKNNKFKLEFNWLKSKNFEFPLNAGFDLMLYDALNKLSVSNIEIIKITDDKKIIFNNPYHSNNKYKTISYIDLVLSFYDLIKNLRFTDCKVLIKP